MSTLTIEKLNAAIRQVQALNVPPPITIWPSDFWPRDYVGDEVYPYRGHPFWQWLKRTTGLGYGLTMERGGPIYQDKPMMMDRTTGRVYCSRRQAAELKRTITAHPR